MLVLKLVNFCRLDVYEPKRDEGQRVLAVLGGEPGVEAVEKERVEDEDALQVAEVVAGLAPLQETEPAARVGGGGGGGWSSLY